MSSEAYDDGDRSHDARTARLIRLSKNQALFRDVNERVAKVAEEFVTYGPLSFVCECSNTECGSQLELTHEEYERVRTVANWFLIRPGHDIRDIEEIVDSNERFAIVAKLDAGATVALVTDPRHAS